MVSMVQQRQTPTSRSEALPSYIQIVRESVVQAADCEVLLTIRGAAETGVRTIAVRMAAEAYCRKGARPNLCAGVRMGGDCMAARLRLAADSGSSDAEVLSLPGHSEHGRMKRGDRTACLRGSLRR